MVSKPDTRKNRFNWTTCLSRRWHAYVNEAIILLRKEGYDVDRYGESRFGWMKWMMEFFVKYTEKATGRKIIQEYEGTEQKKEEQVQTSFEEQVAKAIEMKEEGDESA